MKRRTSISHAVNASLCPYEELYNMAAHSNQSRLARLFDASQGSGSFHAAHCAVLASVKHGTQMRASTGTAQHLQ
eukprot:6032218-Amphidinium_carterae.1